MLLAPQDGLLLFELHRCLLFFVNERLQILPDQIDGPEDIARLAPEQLILVREAWLQTRAHAQAQIDAFVEQNPFDFAPDELDIVRSWRHYVAGEFILQKQLARHAVFVTLSDSPKAYGVVALSETFEQILCRRLPLMVEAVLLPFRDIIIYDGLMSTMNVSFGSGIRRSFNETYQQAKARGIITRLPAADQPESTRSVSAKKRSSPAKARKQAKPGEVADVLKIVIGLTDQFCRDSLNDEYAALCRQLAEKLSRKRPSPLLSGKPNAWACGIVRTVGRVNFLSDPSQDPHLKTPQIDQAFQVSQATGSARAKTICDLFKIGPLDPTWTLPSLLDQNPLIWMFEVNGFLMDIRHAPRGAQVAAYEQGLIPYIPADREAVGKESN